MKHDFPSCINAKLWCEACVNPRECEMACVCIISFKYNSNVPSPPCYINGAGEIKGIGLLKGLDSTV